VTPPAKPRVSVIIPVFNGEDTIAAAVDSALAQRFDSGFEVIAADDGSTDSTREILRGYGARIALLEVSHNGGSAARNSAVRHSTGEYLAFLDADDTWMPQKLERSVAALDAHPECVLAYNDQVEVDAEGNVVSSSMFPGGHAGTPTLDDLLSLKHEYFSIVSSAVVMRRTAFDACGGFDERLRACHDTHLWLLAREHGPFWFVNERLGVRRGGPSEHREEWYVRGAPEFDRAAREHFDVAYRGDLTLVNLMTAGAQAMRRYDCRLARRRYLAALGHRRPLRPKTYARLLLTFAPYSVAFAADRLMHPMPRSREELR
jgi:glycosyltransferase involved in cell wall biosynthesis